MDLYPEITEFIARAKQPTPDFTDPTPLFVQNMGYSPMMTQSFNNIPPIGLQSLAQWFPFFYMIIFLIPFYYITSNLALERESKAREGMKMMGLTDGTYFASWFLVHLAISLFNSVIVSSLAVGFIFKNVSFMLFFMFCLLYSFTFFGWAFMIVAFLPTKKSSGIAATLLHIITFYLSYAIQGPGTTSTVQYSMSLLPNICMN